MQSVSNCLTCHCLGDKIAGVDVDELFAYSTPRVVKIKDRSLGVTKLLLMFAIFCYIIVFQVAYKGEHFEVDEVEGISRMQWQQPTMKWCNPMHKDCLSNITNAENLPYCRQYMGTEEYKGSEQLTCTNKDAWELPVSLPAGVLMPTHISEYEQRRLCGPDVVECTAKFRFEDEASKDAHLQRGTGEAEPVRDVFVADVEQFTVLIDHSFSTASGKLAYDDYAMQGYWLDCSGPGDDCEKKPIKCIHSKCKAMGFELLQETDSDGQRPAPVRSGRRLRTGHEHKDLGLLEDATTEEARQAIGLKTATEQFNVIALSDGDVLSIATMLKMARPGSRLKAAPPGGYNLDDIVSSDGETRRMRGGAIVVRIDYENAGHWRLFRPKDPPTYTISVTMRPANEFKHLYVSRTEGDGREVTKAYGQLIIVQQVGRICTFSIMHALIVLMTAMALLGVSNLVTDTLALYVMPRKEQYTDLKYKVSDDFVTVKKQLAAPVES